MQDVVYSTRRDHQSWVDSAADNPAKRVPCSLVEPVQEIIETVFDHVCCCTVVEPWVEFVDDALEPYDGEQPGGEPGHPCQEEDGECDEAFPSGRVGEQRLHIDIRVRGKEVNSHGTRSFARTDLTHRRTNITSNRPPSLYINKIIIIIYFNFQRNGLQTGRMEYFRP